MKIKLFVTTLILAILISTKANAQYDVKWARELGKEMALNKVEPLYTLKFASNLQKICKLLYGESSNLGASFWGEYRTINDDYLVILDGEDNAMFVNADLSGFDLSNISMIGLNLEKAKFDNCSMFTEFILCNLNNTSWNEVCVDRLIILTCSLREAKLGVNVGFCRNVSFYNSDMRGVNLLNISLNQENTAGGKNNTSSLIMRYCNLADANIPSEIYAQSSIIYCSGIKRKKYEEGEKIKQDTNSFVD